MVLAVLGLWLNSVILGVFSNPNNSEFEIVHINDGYGINITREG